MELLPENPAPVALPGTKKTHVIPDFYAKTEYSSHVCPEIFYSTHTDKSVYSNAKCQE
jgi:hypothetical protein